MLTIYGVYRSRASRNIWLANELGLPFKHVPVIQHYRLPDAKAADAPLHSRSTAFLKVNPNGHIPSIDDDGLVLHESLAINLYLAKKHGGPLARGQPGRGRRNGHVVAVGRHRGRAALDQRSLSPGRQSIGSEGCKGRRCRRRGVAGALRRARRDLGQGRPCLGGRFTVADINVAEIVRYAQAAPELFEANPRVKAWLAACQARPAFRKMWETRDKEPA